MAVDRQDVIALVTQARHVIDQHTIHADRMVATMARRQPTPCMVIMRRGDTLAGDTLRLDMGGVIRWLVLQTLLGSLASVVSNYARIIPPWQMRERRRRYAEEVDDDEEL